MSESAKQADQYTILIVDDEAIARDILEGYLAPEGYNLVYANSGFQALEQLGQSETLPDLILLDVMMPHMDGFEVCQRITANRRWQHIPIILITGFWDKEQVQRGLEAGGTEFILKPINGVELRIRVRAMLGLD
jgi:CheY-like chemotaxis protein